MSELCGLCLCFCFVKVLYFFVYCKFVGSFLGVQDDAGKCEQVYAFMRCISGSMSLLPSLAERIALFVCSLAERCCSRV